jgi:hypothetical protein
MPKKVAFGALAAALASALFLWMIASGWLPADSVGMAISTVRAAQQEAVWVQTIRREGGSSRRSTVAPAVPRQDVEGRPHRKRK